MSLTKFLLSWLFSGILFSQAVTAQDQSDDLIEWNAESPLEWHDYKYRKPKNDKRKIAITMVRISAIGYLIEGEPDFDVKATFVKPESWTTDSTDMSLLRHEQLHFDIGQLYAQKIKAKIDKLKSEDNKSPKTYRGAINNLITLFNAYSGQYDNETAHGTDDKRQAVWEERIYKLLN